MSFTTAQELEYLDEVIIGIFQLIGSPKKLSIMLGAHSFTKGYFGNPKYPGLQFKFPRSNYINCFQIVLNDRTDEYCLKFMDIKPFKTTERGEYQNLPIENIQSVFEEKTGLYLSLKSSQKC
jgi:hypothetical protein